MAITDVPAFAHLTDADIENLAVELDAIRRDIEDSAVSATRAISAARSPRSGPLRWPGGSCWPPDPSVRRGGPAR